MDLKRWWGSRDAATGLANGISRITEDITSLEINTILKPNMTARKMPLILHALLDIADIYHSTLGELAPAQPLPSALYANRATFDALRDAAAAALEALEGSDALPQREQILLLRIKRNCDQIKGMLDRVQGRTGIDLDHQPVDRERVESSDALKAIAISTDDRVLVRKIWDMGVEEVAIQTVVQLDGDVLTRVRPDFASDAWRTLHEIHRTGLDLSVQHWSRLMETIRAFFFSLLRGP